MPVGGVPGASESVRKVFFQPLYSPPVSEPSSPFKWRNIREDGGHNVVITEEHLFGIKNTDSSK